jgi:hypothetical protein
VPGVSSLNNSLLDDLCSLVEVTYQVAEQLHCVEMSTALDCLVTKHLTLLKILFLSACHLIYHYWVGHLTIFLPCLSDLVSCLQSGAYECINGLFMSCLCCNCLELKQLEEVYENFPGLKLQLLFAVELVKLTILLN